MAQHPTIWARGFSGSMPGLHDQSCRCPRHCRKCRDDMPALRAMQARLISGGYMDARGRPGIASGPALSLGPSARFCSRACRRAWWQPARLTRRLRLRAFRKTFRR